MFEWFKSLIGAPDADTSAAQAATGKAQSAMNNALLAQYGAIQDSIGAADTGSETARLASEAAMKRLAGGAMFGAGGFAPMGGNAPTFTRELFGQ